MSAPAHYWGQVPNWLLRHRGEVTLTQRNKAGAVTRVRRLRIPDGAKLLWARLDEYSRLAANPDGKTHKLKLRELAAELGAPERTIKDWIAILKAAGILEVDLHRQRCEGSRYGPLSSGPATREASETTSGNGLPEVVETHRDLGQRVAPASGNGLPEPRATGCPAPSVDLSEEEEDLFALRAPDGPKTAKARKGAAPKRATRCPPSDASREDVAGWLASLGLYVSPDVEHWLDHHRAKGSTFVDWQASWRTWQRNGDRFARRGPPGQQREPLGGPLWERADPRAYQRAGGGQS